LNDSIEEKEKTKDAPKESAWVVFKEGIIYLAKHKFILAFVFGKAMGSAVWGAIDTVCIFISLTIIFQSIICRLLLEKLKFIP
jgi:hypothetical protein